MRRIEGIIHDPKDRYPQSEVDVQFGPIKKVVFQDRVPNEKESAAIKAFRNYSRRRGYKLLFPIIRTKRD